MGGASIGSERARALALGWGEPERVKSLSDGTREYNNIYVHNGDQRRSYGRYVLHCDESSVAM